MRVTLCDEEKAVLHFAVDCGTTYVIIVSSLPDMSFLFDKRTKKIINAAWAVIAVLIIIGMVLFFAPGLIPGF